MKKRVHPIRKMLTQLDNTIWWNEKGSTGQAEKIAARHVKPLLDALASYTKMHYGCRDTGKPCADCLLLAAWKEPL